MESTKQIQINLPYLALARVSGADAGSFLQAQLTADISHLADGQSVFSGYCDPKGNTLAVLRLTRDGDDYNLIAASELMEPLLARFRKYILRAHVKFEATDDTVVGVRTDGATDYLAYSPGADGAESDLKSTEAWRAGEIREGLVWLGTATSGQFLPQMLGLDRIGALSFRKGCFPGQEIIARVRYLGRLKQLPLAVQVEGRVDCRPGDDGQLRSAEGQQATATVVDFAIDGKLTALFLVARMDEAYQPHVLELGGQTYSLRR